MYLTKPVICGAVKFDAPLILNTLSALPVVIIALSPIAAIVTVVVVEVVVNVLPG